MSDVVAHQVINHTSPVEMALLLLFTVVVLVGTRVGSVTRSKLHEWRAPDYKRVLQPHDFTPHFAPLWSGRVLWARRTRSPWVAADAATSATALHDDDPPELVRLGGGADELELRGRAVASPAVVQAFNPSVVVLRNGSLLSYYRLATNHACLTVQRTGKYAERGHPHMIHALGGALLNETLAPTRPPFVVSLPLRTTTGGDVRCDTHMPGENIPTHEQDPRLFWWGHRLMLLLTVGNCEDSPAHFGRQTRLYLSEISQTTLQPLAFAAPIVLVQRTGGRRTELPSNCKNWVPFVVPSSSSSSSPPDLFLEFHIEPREVLKLNNPEALYRDNPAVAAEFVRLPITSSVWPMLQQQKWGARIRGSVPSVRLPPALGGGFLGLGHIVRSHQEPIDFTKVVYEHVFYTFEAHEGGTGQGGRFAITGVSLPFELASLSSASSPPHALPSSSVAPHVQFAVGMVLQQTAEQPQGGGQWLGTDAGAYALLISFGEKDCEGGFVTLSLAAALQSVPKLPEADIDAKRNYVCNDEMDSAGQDLMTGGMPYKITEKWTKGAVLHECAGTCDALGSLCAGFVLVKAGEGAGCWFKRGPASLKPLSRAGAHLCAKKEMGSLPTLPIATQEPAGDSDNDEEHHTGL